MSSPPAHALLAKTGVFARCGQESVAALTSPLPLAFLLPLAAADALLLIALSRFTHAPLDAALAPLFVLVGGERALHYPDAWVVLPTVFRWMRLPGLFLVGSLGIAAVAAALPDVFCGRAADAKAALLLVRRRLPAVWAVSLPGLILVGGGVVLADAVAIATVPNPGTLAAVLALRGSALVVQALLAYAVVALVTSDLPPLAAIRRSVHLATHNFWLTVGFVLVAQALLWPVASLEGGAERWFAAARPEIVFAFVGARIALSTVATFLVTAACTRLYLHWFGRVLLDG